MCGGGWGVWVGMSPDCTLGGLGVRFCFLLWLYVFLLRMPENLNMALVGTECE